MFAGLNDSAGFWSMLPRSLVIEVLQGCVSDF
jgi:hypothetical protein